jgi:hypothetical protein
MSPPMSRISILILISFILLVACTAAPTATPAPTNTPLPTATPQPTNTPLPTVTLTSANTPLPTAMLLPMRTSTPASTIFDANFVPPVDPNLVPLYNAFDLDPQKGVVKTQSSSYPARTDFKCNGSYFYPGTPDNHFGWDWGTGNCSKHLIGTPVNGMSVGFEGRVVSVGLQGPNYPIRVDYGLIRCTDGKVRNIHIQFAHSLPNVKGGDKVSRETVIAHLESISVEIEIQVFADLTNIDPQLLGLKLP